MFDQSLAIAQRNGDQLMVAYAHLGLALIASRAGDAQTAATLHGTADAIHNKLGTRFDSLESGCAMPTSPDCERRSVTPHLRPHTTRAAHPEVPAVVARA